MACTVAWRTSLLASTAAAALITAADVQAQEAEELPTITVQAPAQQTPPSAEGEGTGGGEAPELAAPESAWGPVDGIVATRSATATKTDTPILETPQSISVVTADQMEQMGVTSVSEALGYTAGVTGSAYGVDTRFDWLKIRGFDAYLPGFFVDGMLARNNNTWAVWKVEPYGTERIEVLKGPPSVLYGQANVGGMVNVVSKRPTEEPLHEVEVRAGNHDRLEGRFDLSGPVTDVGTWFYRLTGLGFGTDTQVDFTDQERAFIAPALTWKPSAGTSLTLLGQYLKDDSVPTIGFLPAEGTLLPNPNGRVRNSFFTGEPGYDQFLLEQWAIGYLFEHRFNDTWQMRQNLRYREMDVDYKQVYGTGLEADQRSLTRNAFTSDEYLRAFTIDNQLQADFATGPIEHKLLAGVDYQRNKFDQRAGSGATTSIDMYDPDYGATITDPPLYADVATTISQTGLYLQEQAKLYDRWVFVLGGRYDWATNETGNRLAGGVDTEQDYQAFTWKAGVLYHAPNGVAPYFSYAESFFPVVGTDAETGEPFDPETGQQYEVGIKYEPPGTKSRYTFAAFDITRQNYLTTEPGNSFIQRQTGEIKSRGLEFEAVTELTDGLDLIAAYSWLPTFEITESADPAEIGKRQPGVAEHEASLWAHYSFQYGPLAGFGFGGGVRYRGETFGDITNSDLMIVPDVTLLDAVVDYEVDGWRFAVNVQNLEDKAYLAACDITCYYGTGRTVMASVRRRW